jgi:HTH-type transcriptional regulator / antitoxin HipB
MDYPIQSPGQLSAHLRSLRKSRGLNQVQLGAVLGVGQTRIARIERDPTAVSVEQFLALLGALGVQMVLRANGRGSVADASADASSATTTRPALTRRRPLGEPW